MANCNWNYAEQLDNIVRRTATSLSLFVPVYYISGPFSAARDHKIVNGIRQYGGVPRWDATIRMEKPEWEKTSIATRKDEWSTRNNALDDGSSWAWQDARNSTLENQKWLWLIMFNILRVYVSCVRMVPVNGVWSGRRAPSTALPNPDKNCVCMPANGE